MNTSPAPHVPGNTETERMDNAVRIIFSVSKDELRKQAQARKKRAKAKKSIPSQALSSRVLDGGIVALISHYPRSA
jgi:hypothetical protein